MFALIFYEREVKIMEVTGIALQTVAAGEDVAFTAPAYVTEQNGTEPYTSSPPGSHP